ncbi:MAG: glycosyltransferase [Fibrobacter sp.]|jgi:cellulose synthase/poly-beta-1,6-N-acetylglucosamine synthase-like glycosyltransferase|nr:glycosyltransferase [Fibrobacter sp.]
MYILLLLLFCYSIVILRLISVLSSKEPAAVEKRSFHPVSIVIPFRNEQKHLETLLQSLQQQSYSGSYEILLINDGSTDQSFKIINEFKKHSAVEITVLDSPYDPALGLTSKQQALDFGIDKARYEWIALTDADMKLLPQWLDSLMMSSDQNTDMVFGHTAIMTDNRVFTHIQAFQLEFLFCAAHAFHKVGITGSCMGNNMLVSKQAYQKAGGQKAIGYNMVEDRALLNLFKQKKMNISCTEPFLPLALTYPCENWHLFFHQVKRWARGGFVWHSSLFFIGLLFSLQNVMLFLTCLSILPQTLTIITIGNFLLTWLFTALCFRKIRSSQNFIYFPFFLLFLLFETILFLLSFFSKSDVEWKGRKLNR